MFMAEETEVQGWRRAVGRAAARRELRGWPRITCVSSVLPLLGRGRAARQAGFRAQSRPGLTPWRRTRARPTAGTEPAFASSYLHRTQAAALLPGASLRSFVPAATGDSITGQGTKLTHVQGLHPQAVSTSQSTTGRRAGPGTAPPLSLRHNPWQELVTRARANPGQVDDLGTFISQTFPRQFSWGLRGYWGRSPCR